MKLDYTKLTDALAQAKHEALKYAFEDDGGTCNFDTPLLYIEGTSEKTLVKMYGAEYGVWKPYPKAYCIGGRLMCGQGNRRTKMAEVFADTMRKLGYQCYVRYVMD